MVKSSLPDTSELNRLLEYDEETGRVSYRPRPLSLFKSERDWRAWNTRFANQNAFFSNNGEGYLKGAIHNKRYYAHRIIWKMVHGTEPIQIDHINGNKSDNRILNLREADFNINARNKSLPKKNTSGFLGVGWHTKRRRWYATIRVSGKTKTKYFVSYEDAVACRQSWNSENGFHENHGRVT